MKILQVYNKRDKWGGEDYAVESTIDILERKGERVVSWTIRNSDLMSCFGGKVKAFAYGMYSPSMRHEMEDVISLEQPDVVHAHNLYPFFSPSVLVACRQARIPTVLHCHSHLLTCPITLQFRNGKVCELCTPGREYWCVLKNCRRNFIESIGYALRSAVARKWRLFSDNVTFFITTANFMKQRLIEAKFSKKQIVVLPCSNNIAPSPANASIGKYVIFAGRLSAEKGVETLLAAARLLPLVKFLIAGDGPIRKELCTIAPENVTFLGWLDKEQLSALYNKTRIAVLPSTCLETFGLAVTDAMSNGLPVVASRIGGPLEIVEEGITGLFFQPGNPKDLADKISNLWAQPDLCRRLGQAGLEKTIREYSEDIFYQRLMAVYQKAIVTTKQG